MPEIRIALAELPVSREAVLVECGGVGTDLAGTLEATIDSLLARAQEHMEVRAGYVLSGTRPETGPVIGEQLAGAERYAVLLATLGAAFDRWPRCLHDDGDPFAAYVAHSIGSVAVEAAVDRVVATIAEDVQPDGITNRFSPGYCGWDVAGQHHLFRLLPLGFLAVRLTESSLMTPLKSVSGIVGIGPGLSPRDYPCEVCPREGCQVAAGRCP